VAVGIIIGLGTILYYESLTRIKAAQTSALELSTPVFATLLAYFMLTEIPTIMQFVGVLLLLLGLFFISRREK
jgi:drug/metabolite transporter (DMT)-like permease